MDEGVEGGMANMTIWSVGGGGGGVAHEAAGIDVSVSFVVKRERSSDGKSSG